MRKQLLIAIHGPSGSGKSTIVDLIKTKLKPSVVLGSDRLRFHITDYKGNNKKQYFDLTREIMMGMVSDYIKKGFNVIIDDQLKSEHVNRLRKIAEDMSVKFLSYEISISRDRINENFDKREKETDWTKPEEEFIDWQYNDYMNNKDNDSVILKVEELDIDKIAEMILKDINA